MVGRCNTRREEIQAKLWVEFIKSEDNPADAFTRWQKMEFMIRFSDAELVEYTVPHQQKVDRDYLQEAEELLYMADNWREFPEMWGRVRKVWVTPKEGEGEPHWEHLVVH